MKDRIMELNQDHQVSPLQNFTPGSFMEEIRINGEDNIFEGTFQFDDIQEVTNENQNLSNLMEKSYLELTEMKSILLRDISRIKRKQIQRKKNAILEFDTTVHYNTIQELTVNDLNQKCNELSVKEKMNEQENFQIQELITPEALKMIENVIYKNERDNIRNDDYFYDELRNSFIMAKQDDIKLEIPDSIGESGKNEIPDIELLIGEETEFQIFRKNFFPRKSHSKIFYSILEAAQLGKISLFQEHPETYGPIIMHPVN